MQQTMPDVGTIKSGLKLACRAPSIHNSQPWHWVLDGSALQLFVDRVRLVDVADSSGREAIMSCGTALDHLRVAMAALGWQTVTERFPDSDNRDLLATIGFRPLEFVSEVQYRRADAILERRTDRLPLRPPKFWTWFVPELRKTVGDGGSVMVDVLSNEVRPQLASASVSTKVVRSHDPATKPNCNGGQPHSRCRRVSLRMRSHLRPKRSALTSRGTFLPRTKQSGAVDSEWTGRRFWCSLPGPTIVQRYCTAAKCSLPSSWNARSRVWRPAR